MEKEIRNTAIKYTLKIGNSEYFRIFNHPGNYLEAIKALKVKISMDGIDELIIHTPNPKAENPRILKMIEEKNKILEHCRCDITASKIRQDIADLKQQLL